MLATLALVGPRLLAPLAPVAALTDLPRPVPESSARALPVVRAAVFGTAVAIPFATLFLTADAAFAAMADGVPRPPPPTRFRAGRPPSSSSCWLP
jgi:hypothetical protein